KSRANSPQDGSPTTYVDCGCTGSSSGSPKLTAIASPPRDCEPLCSTPGSTTDRCDPDWPSSRPLQPIRYSPWPNPSAPPKPPSTHGTNMKSSQHKNLTQPLHKALDQGL